MKRRAKILLTVPVLLLGLAGFFIISEAAPADQFAQVSNGMTKVQIRDLLGAPHHMRHDDRDGTAFSYGGFQHAKWCSMEVRFGSDGRVTGKFHDH